MKIVIDRKFVYGNVKYYPVCETAKLFADIAGTTTLTKAVLYKIKSLGYEVTFAPAPVEII